MTDKMRVAHNYLFRAKNNDYQPQELDLLNNYLEYEKNQKLSKSKVALLLVSVNQNYWSYAGQVVEDIKKYFLPGHQTDLFLWSDMPEFKTDQFSQREKAITEMEEGFKSEQDPAKKQQLIFTIFQQFIEAFYLGTPINQDQVVFAARTLGLTAELQALPNGQANLILHGTNENTALQLVTATKELLRKQKHLQENTTKFEVEPIEWPYGTLMRYSMFLQQEEAFKDYDYVFYMDVDMRIVNVVGDEILGEGLTMAEHPMYSLRKEYVPPYEPNNESSAYIPRLGTIVNEEGKPRFKPLYAAGGFQGGKAKLFIEAMKAMRESINKDFNKNYVAIWNDESHWNRYLYDYKGHLISLSPSYIYPDSLIEEYYKPLWGRNYSPKIITLTKPFTLQKLDSSRFQGMPK